MIFRITILITILISFRFQSQRRNYFSDSDKVPNCDLVKKGNFTTNEKNDKSFKVRFRKNRMTEVFGNKDIIVESKLNMLSKCKFEAEITKIKTRLKMTDGFIYVGKKTVYEVVETGKNSIIYEYWCNEGRNMCTEILEKE